MDNEAETFKSSNADASEYGPAGVRWLVLQIFIPLLNGDSDAASVVRRFGDGLVLQGTAMTFTLPALHQFVRRALGGPNDRDDFAAFRRGLYGLDVNRILRESGGLVVVARPDDDPERRLYRLERTGSP